MSATVSSDSFPTTRWTIVIQTCDDDPEKAAKAMESLCLQYRAPLLQFAISTGLSIHDAEDVVQDFLAKILRTQLFAKVEEGQGRLRTYLLKSIRNFLRDHWRKKSAIKRSGEDPHTPLEMVDEVPDPRQELESFDRAWAKEIMDQALESLKDSYQQKERLELFEFLFDIVHGTEPDEQDLFQICRRYDLKPNSISQAKSRFLKALGKEIRSVISHTVDTPEKVEEEIRHFRDIWGT